MICASAAHVIGLPTSSSRSETEINLLEIDEKPFVEASELLEDIATDQEDRAHYLIDGTCLTVIPFRHEVRREYRWQEAIKAQHRR